MKKVFLSLLFLSISFIFCNKIKAQFLMDMVDTTKEAGKGLLNIYKKFDHLKISCYMQPQFQIAEAKGISSFEGPDFNDEVSNRLLLRRSRLRFDYINFGNTKKPGVQITFQFDANERGFTLRDVWGRVFENKYQLFSFTTGMFARPFGYETNLSSSVRESPERGRMNQQLMKSERDLGAMISFDARKKIKGLQYLKVDVGIFNGQGINAKGDFDNVKDFIARVALKPYKISDKVSVSMGTSVLLGGLLQNTKYVFFTGDVNGTKKILVDSAISNKGKNAPRNYFGDTEIRGEFISGKHAVLENSNSTPISLLTGKEGYYIRNFNGAYFYFIQPIFSTKHQLFLKYDWFDPNTKIKSTDIGKVGSNFSSSNIKYHTLGVGYINHFSDNVKLTLYYAKVWNEKTQLTGFTKDIKDNVFTCRLQFWF